MKSVNPWAARISALRDKGMTLSAIGAAVGLSPSSICDLERGRSKAPTGEAALKLDALYSLRCSSKKPAQSLDGINKRMARLEKLRGGA